MILVEGVKFVSVIKVLVDELCLCEVVKEEVVGCLLDYVVKLEGLLCNVLIYVVGVVIGDCLLDCLVLFYCDLVFDMFVMQFNMKWVEQVGLVKFDFLGLKMLIVIQNVVDLVNGGGCLLYVVVDGCQFYQFVDGVENQINVILLEDMVSYELFVLVCMVVVFQVEFSGMMDVLWCMKFICIEDIVVFVVFYCFGLMENILIYCEVKNGLCELELLYFSIDFILVEMQGIIVYQEQVMQIVQVMVGYSFGGVDLLCCVMGKKIVEEMVKEWLKFVEGLLVNGVDKKKVGEVFDLLEKFVNYGFNKFYVVVYVVVSYQMVWLKVNYLVEFMVVVMNCDIYLIDKLVVYKCEVDCMGIEMVLFCVNCLIVMFSVCEGCIYYVFGVLKGVGVEVMNLIVQVCGDQLFCDLYDFVCCVDMCCVGKCLFEMLVWVGVFDLLEENCVKVMKLLDGLVVWFVVVQVQVVLL